MKKVTISFYTNKDANSVVNAIKYENLLPYGTTIENLTATKVEDVELGFKLKRNLVFAAKRRGYNYQKFMDGGIFDIVERDKYSTELQKLCDYHGIKLDELNEYVVLNRRVRDTNNSVAIELGYDISDMFMIYNINNKKEVFRLSNNSNCFSYYNDYMSTLLRPLGEGRYMGITTRIDPKVFLLFSDLQPAEVFGLYMKNRLCTEEELQDENIRNILFKKMNKLIKKNIEEGKDTVLFSMFKYLFEVAKSVYRIDYRNGKGVALSDLDINVASHFTKDQILQLFNLITTGVKNKREIIKILSLQMSELSRIEVVSVDEYSILCIDILSMIGYISEEEKEIIYNKPNEDEATPYELFKFDIASLAINCLKGNNFRPELANDSWSTKIACGYISSMNAVLADDNIGGCLAITIFNNMTTEQREEIKSLIKNNISRYFIIKESNYIFNHIFSYFFSLMPNFSTFMKETILECLEDANGRESMSVRSLCNNGVYLNSENILQTIDSKYKKLRRYVMEFKLKSH